MKKTLIFIALIMSTSSLYSKNHIKHKVLKSCDAERHYKKDKYSHIKFQRKIELVNENNKLYIIVYHSDSRIDFYPVYNLPSEATDVTNVLVKAKFNAPSKEDIKKGKVHFEATKKAPDTEIFFDSSQRAYQFEKNGNLTFFYRCKSNLKKQFTGF